MWRLSLPTGSVNTDEPLPRQAYHPMTQGKIEPWVAWINPSTLTRRMRATCSGS